MCVCVCVVCCVGVNVVSVCVTLNLTVIQYSLLLLRLLSIQIPSKTVLDGRIGNHRRIRIGQHLVADKVHRAQLQVNRPERVRAEEVARRGGEVYERTKSKAFDDDDIGKC